MASPFRLFRKYQKTLLVLAGVALMFVFVLGDSLSAILRRVGGPGSGPSSMADGSVAVRWDDGKLTNAELNALVVRRRIVNQFVRGVEAEGRLAALDAGAEPRPLAVEMIVGPETPQQGVEQDIVRMKLFGEAARRAGMTVPDKDIIHYLDELGRGRVSRDRMRAMLARMPLAGRGASIDYIFEGLREEMLARNYLASYQYALATVTPEERWQDWLRVNDRVVVEAAALPAESFLVDVPEPTDAELAEFFDFYKEREPQPDFVGNTEMPSPWPGFAIPRKVDVRFVRADYDQFLSKLEEEVTDQEIQEYYDANQEYFIRADSGLDVSSDTSVEAATDADEQKSPGGDTDASSAEQSPDESSSPAADDAETSGDGATPTTEDSSRLDGRLRHGPFRLTAFEENGNAEEPAETPSTETAAAEAPTAEASSSEIDQVAADQGDAGSAERPVEYQPLEEVQDQIRRELASQKVKERLLGLMSRLKSQLTGGFSKYFGLVLDAQAAGKEPPPPPAELADLSALAAEHGLDYGDTGPVSMLELRDHPLGRSVDADTNEPLLRMVFSNELDLYQPITTFDVDNNRFLALKVSDTPRRVPELSEVRDEVVRAWKLGRAAELAAKRARELAAKIQQAGSTLTEYFADDSSVSVVETDPFAWLTIGDISPRTDMVEFRLSEPAGVVAAGPDFMSAVFDLAADQVGGVLNHDHSIAYVVRVVEHRDTPEGLRKTYLAEADQWYGLATMYQLHVRNAAVVLLAGYREAAGVEWLRDPDRIIREEE